MLSNFIIALEAVLPIFMIMGIGMLIRRKGLVDCLLYTSCRHCRSKYI